MKFAEISNLFRLLGKPTYLRYCAKHFFGEKKDGSRLDLYKHIVKPGDLVFDVGANMGNRSKIFLELGARVVAFEPQPYCSEFLSRAFHGIRDFKLLTSAVSNLETTVTMHLSNTHTLSTIDEDWLGRMHHGGRFQDQRWNSTVSVPTITLDRAIAEHGLPDFIKIDVEGHELNAIKGLSKPVRQLSFEFASESLDRTFLCLDHLDGIGAYEYRISLGESMVFHGAQWDGSSEIKQLLRELQQQDVLTWGDVYARLAPMRRR